MAEQGSSISRLALQFALQNDLVSTTLIGMSSEAEVIENASMVGSRPDKQLLAAVENIIEPVKNISWQSGPPDHFEPGAVRPSAG